MITPRVAATFAGGAEPEWFSTLDERERVANYLADGVAILYTTAKAPDVLEPQRGTTVGLSVRSDGVWVWSDAHAYYAREHGVAPEADFLDHIRSRDYTCRQIDSDTAAELLEGFYSVRGTG